jgi:hypothetical protein
MLVEMMEERGNCIEMLKRCIELKKKGMDQK